MAKPEFEIYTSILTSSHIYIKGRFLRPWGAISKYNDGLVISFFKTILRAWSREIKNHPIEIRISDMTFNVFSDSEGYFQLCTPCTSLLNLKGSLVSKSKVSKSFILKDYRKLKEVGIISDIDDTILLTNVTGLFKIRMLINTVFINPFKRKSLKFAKQFYKQIVNENGGEMPVFYVSNSPWNMYAYLKKFLKHNDFPVGEIQLRDFGIHMFARKKSIELLNKYLEVEHIFKILKDSKFILIGDSAEHDYNVYSRIQEKYPNQVQQIIIVKAGSRKNEDRIFKNLQNVSTNALLVESYEDLLTPME